MMSVELYKSWLSLNLLQLKNLILPLTKYGLIRMDAL